MIADKMENQFKEIASLIGDPTRATIMWTLLDGKAFTATELAIAADTTAPNISMHLTKLVQAGLLCAESQGRHRYFKFSRKEIAYAIEAIANLIPPSIVKQNTKEEKSPIKYCRTCYDHLAGSVGVAITDSLLRQGFIVYHDDVFEITGKGEGWFSGFGINVNELKQQRRSFLRPCLDWSERRHHIAGSVATALLDKMLLVDWIRRTKNSRVITITSKGQIELYEHFKLTV